MEICPDVNSDFISNLPSNVTDQILVRLPIEDAVRTSVLSTKWRYKWTTITQLVFHDDLVQLPSPHDNNNNSNDKLINFINLVFLLHSGFIHKLELSTKCLQISSSMIDAWIFFISKKNIKEFVFQFPYQERRKYKLPSCFFSAQQFCNLELHCCVLKPPPTFTGFSNLKSLFLFQTTFVDKGGFECLISKCPLLERLEFGETNHNHDHVNICSPNLKSLCLLGCFNDICFENTPLLSDVSIGFYNDITDEMAEKFLRMETRNVVKVLSSLPSLRNFVVTNCFLKFLCLAKIPEKLPFTCHHLTYLSLDLNFGCLNEICVTLCLLNSSPNLRQLEIESIAFSKLSGHNSENFWEGRTLIDWNMGGLQIVIIRNTKGFELELEFIKLLLANSLMLEMLIIRSGELNNDRKGLEFLKELVTFPRASPKARIKFFEWNKK